MRKPAIATAGAPANWQQGADQTLSSHFTVRRTGQLHVLWKLAGVLGSFVACALYLVLGFALYVGIF